MQLAARADDSVLQGCEPQRVFVLKTRTPSTFYNSTTRVLKHRTEPMLRRDASLHAPHGNVHGQHARAGRGVRALPSLPHEGVAGPVHLAGAQRVEAAEDGAHAEQQQQPAAAEREREEQYALALAVGAVDARPAVVAAG